MKIDITEDSYNYIKSLAEPFEDTTASVIERIIADHKLMAPSETNKVAKPSPSLTMEFGLNNLPNVSFSSLKSASISNTPVKSLYWNDVLEELIAHSAKTHQLASITEVVSLQIQQGKCTDKGYRHIEAVGISFQGVDAARACKSIVALSSKFNIPVEIELIWQDNPKAQYAGQTGKLVLP